MPQGLPKYLSASFVRAGANGIAHALLGPARVSTTTLSGTHVTITSNTTYPFGSILNYEITSSAAFTLHLRVPSWYVPSASSIELNNNGALYRLTPDNQTGMTSIQIPPGSNKVTYTLGAEIRTEARANGSIAIYHGALLYALDVGQTATSLPVSLYNESFTYPTTDYPPDLVTPQSNMPSKVHDVAFTNTKPWNMAIDPRTLKFCNFASNTSTSKLKDPIFDYEAPPGYIIGKGCQIDWVLDKGVPAALPKLPRGSGWLCISNVTDVIFRP